MNMPVYVYSLMTNGQEISINVSASNWTSYVTVTKSWLGPVLTSGVSFLMEAIFSNIVYPIESLNVPAGLTISNLQNQFFKNYNVISFDALYKSPPFLTCPDNSECAIGNTCCLWGNSYGCCTLPSAECCSTGCCLQGCECDGDECYC